LLLALVSAFAACSEGPTRAATRPEVAPPVEVVAEAEPLAGEQLDAMRALASTSSGTPIVAGSGAAHGADAGPDAHTHDGTVSATENWPAALAAEVAQARRTAEAMARQPLLSRAGYHIGSYWSAGIGTHYIDWRLVGKAFDPAHPAMVLVDTAPGHHRRLAGLSYWVGSQGPPVGFTGDFDKWHNHRGLCFIDGALAREDVVQPSACEGTWIDGADLWMLHVWVVPGYDNPKGLFAPMNPKLCAPRRGADAGPCEPSAF
jgi:hypothetical protein